MKQVKGLLRATDLIARDTIQYQIELSPALLTEIKPGQFVHVRIDQTAAHMLRRPISICDIDFEKNLLTLIFKVVGKGTAKLKEKQIETMIDLLIPCGNGYPLDELDAEHVLLIGGGIGVPPLYYLAKKLTEQGIKVTAVLGFQSKADVFYEDAFKALGDCFITTNDGSYGDTGFVTDVIEQRQLTGDYYFSCGPTLMLKAVKTKMQAVPGYISLEERMGCGIGACYACVIDKADDSGNVKICHDGPVFRANEVIL
ncbi:dihydroorotate oxidase B electron transfer subunit [Streptohalobacillus salinus]|uniref:Dihydroorotate dehydrogenase B (NAD(+)), electron transfer subunit n=1 Tax=Streptohalobacillus salinus TaxID=621096 RepID=A0A2V3WJ71_9BACI|nr:dihydroorotate dehydrogenase electron transfer subunit [Streptohalobacillus salinus]PXW92588.1 dihydroorotate oxidase B electron transfer subunit [Streptohalobacillus salinus]